MVASREGPWEGRREGQRIGAVGVVLRGEQDENHLEDQQVVATAVLAVLQPLGMLAAGPSVAGAAAVVVGMFLPMAGTCGPGAAGTDPLVED
eukprot:m.234921 g.234921  ORF g.234921 m.234921 type:complete len:92 (+) comp18920_c3_seq1:2761-3036(+)